MTALLALTGAVLVTWVLRVLVITVLPASRLPDRVRQTLPDVGPAVLAALVAAALFAAPGGPDPVWLVGVAVTGVLAWRTHRIGLSTVAGLAAVALLELV
jgi:branched-subunit amino acid transport protein